MTDVLVVAELFENKLRRTTHSAVTFAQEIAKATGGKFDILVLGEGAEASAKEASNLGAGKVMWAEISGGYICERYAPTVAQVTQDGSYGVLAATASTFGKDLLPRVAAKLGAGIAPDVTSLNIDGGKLRYTRPMFAGNVFGTVEISSSVQVVSVRQSEFEAANPSGASSPVESITPTNDPVADKLQFVSLETVKSERPDLTEADVVISGGRALKSAENFEKLLEPLVDLVGGAMGASRAACDAGYVPNDLQVGQTGKVVAPKLYIAVGISGAIQHLAGMKGSKVIVAINKDKEAPIAQVADYFLAEDLFKVLPELTEGVRALQK